MVYALVFGIVGSVISTVAAVAGGVMAYKQGVAQSKALRYSQAVSEQEALNAERIVDKNSQMQQYQASQDAKQLQRKYMVLEGQAEAARAGSGIGGGSVSEGDIATDIFKSRKADEMTIRHNADLASWQIRTAGDFDAWSARTQAAQYGAASKEALKAGKMSLITSVLTASAQTAQAVGKYGGSKTTSKTPTTGYQAYGSPSYTRTFTGNTAATYKMGGN